MDDRILGAKSRISCSRAARLISQVMGFASIAGFSLSTGMSAQTRFFFPFLSWLGIRKEVTLRNQAWFPIRKRREGWREIKV